MENRLEKIIKAVYRNWKKEYSRPDAKHLDAEAMACFLENKLPAEESEQIKAHLISCAHCAEVIAVQSGLISQDSRVPENLVAQAKELVASKDKASVLEIFLKAKENLLEILNTTGDILLGQELIPAPLFRSRQIKEFKDEVVILKDFKDIAVEIKVENKQGRYFNLSVLAKNKNTQAIIKDLRVTLMQDNQELESYLSSAGKVIFEHVLLGRYKIEICSIEAKVVSILLEIKR